MVSRQKPIIGAGPFPPDTEKSTLAAAITERVPRVLDVLVGTFHKAAMLRRARGSTIVRVAAVASVVVVLAGCASVRQTVGGWFGRTPSAEKAAAKSVPGPRVYYANVGGLNVYAEPSASSKVVGALSLHEKVTRSRVERGYAYVESTKSGVRGWVDNAGLTWRSPTAPPAAASTPGEPKPEEPAAPPAEDVQAPVAPQPVPTNAENRVTSTTVPAPPRSKKTTGGVPPSIFDAY